MVQSKYTCLLFFLVEVLIYKVDFLIQYTLPLITVFLIASLYSIVPKIHVTTIPSLIIFGTGVFGYLTANSKNSSLGTSIGLILPGELHKSTLAIFCLTASSLALGNHLMINDTYRSLFGSFKITSSQNKFIGAFCLIPVFLMLIGFKTDEFFYRENHLLNTNFPFLARLGSALSIVAVPVVAYWSNNQNRKFRYFAYGEILVYTILFISTSSRSLVVIPISILIILLPKIRKIGKFVCLFCFPIVVYFSLAIPLFLRSLGAKGLFPYLSALNSYRFSSVSFLEILQNFTVSFDLNGLTAFAQTKFPIGDLLVELSPLPGDQAGWYEISSNHRFNLATPSPAIGEAANYGLVTLLFTFVGVGLMFSLLFRAALSFSKTFTDVILSFLIVSASYFSILCLQYNLRSAMRIVYYSIALVAVSLLIEKSRKNRA